ncbi:hypothetical protein, partial [Specibacter cremeus]|uniref:hypothetical protein n=1 Tax=Specibacter cremeus TaxID=1629051 RepID=UPI00197B5156
GGSFAAVVVRTAFVATLIASLTRAAVIPVPVGGTVTTVVERAPLTVTGALVTTRAGAPVIP